MEFVSKTTISSSVSSVTITGLTNYPRYKVFVSGFSPSGQCNWLYYLTDSAGTAYTSSYGNIIRRTSTSSGNNLAYGQLTTDTYSGYDTTMELTLDETADGKMVSLTGTTTDRANTAGTAPYQSNTVFSTLTSASNIAVGGIKFAPSTAVNIIRGTIIIYGIKDS